MISYINRDNFFIPINTITLVTKYYRYSNTIAKRYLNITYMYTLKLQKYTMSKIWWKG